MPYDKQTKSRKLYIYLNVLVISKTKKKYLLSFQKNNSAYFKVSLITCNKQISYFHFCLFAIDLCSKSSRRMRKRFLDNFMQNYSLSPYICIRNILNVWVRWIHVYSHFPIFLYSSYFNIDTIKCLHYVPRISRLWCFLDFMNLDRTDKILTFEYIKLNNWIQRY